MDQGLLLIQELLVLAVEVQRLFEILLHVVADSYLVDGDLSAFKVVEQLRAEIQPLQEFDGGVVLASVFLDEGHAKGHMCFSLNVTHFDARSRFHLHILELAHLILRHAFQRKPTWHDLIHQAEVLGHLHGKLARKWAGSLGCGHGLALIVLCVYFAHDVKLVCSVLFLFFFHPVHFVVVHLVVQANFVENFAATVLELQCGVWVTVGVLILSQEGVLALEQVHVTLELLLLDLQIIQRFLHRRHQHFIEGILQGILLKLIDTCRTLSLLDLPDQHLRLIGFLFVICKSLGLNNLIQKLN